MPIGFHNANKRIIPFFLWIDSSRSMEGESILIINHICKRLISHLKEYLNDYSFSYEIEIAVLQFGTENKWITGNKLVPIIGFEWIDIHANGCSNFYNA